MTPLPRAEPFIHDVIGNSGFPLERASIGSGRQVFSSPGLERKELSFGIYPMLFLDGTGKKVSTL
jgi:hypothetical protein